MSRNLLLLGPTNFFIITHDRAIGAGVEMLKRLGGGPRTMTPSLCLIKHRLIKLLHMRPRIIILKKAHAS